MSMRFYFYTANGTELSDHPLNGVEMSAMGPCIHTGKAGHVHDHSYNTRCERLTVTRGHWAKGRRWVSTDVSAKDFDNVRTRVKFWTPGKDGRPTAEWTWLTPVRTVECTAQTDLAGVTIRSPKGGELRIPADCFTDKLYVSFAPIARTILDALAKGPAGTIVPCPLDTLAMEACTAVVATHRYNVSGDDCGNPYTAPDAT